MSDPQETLEFAGEREASAPCFSNSETPSNGRYQILRPHARGGLGQVFLAHDLELNRQVAVKEIQDRHAHDEDKRQRFILEAEITGMLEHPGVIPVYGLGKHTDGRPYYAMRFLNGKSLKEAISDFHAAEQSPRHYYLELRRLLGRFIAVCNTIAYSHSRGVLHRDLKPANIMLGAFGETLVVDWGLAKVVGRSEKISESPNAPPANVTHADDLTAGGAVMGTPEYMSPEQAAGQHEEMGPHSDIFSLGATLYCMLTGRGPFAGHSVTEVLDRARRGKVSSPLDENERTPVALAAICLKAMSVRPSDRYASAQDLAADIENWLADEPVHAHRASMLTRVVRWFRRNSLLVTVAGVFLAVILMLLPLLLAILTLAGAAE